MRWATSMQCLGALALQIWVLAAGAEEVHHPYQGLTLNADYALAPGKTPADPVVLITHGALAHRDMESLVYLRQLLGQRGYSTLAINLSLASDDRHGMYDCAQPQRHRNDDALDEIGAWLKWLSGQGAKQVVLLGHSRGGAQTALYAAERNSPLVKAVVLLAPATADNTGPAAYDARYKRQLGPLLQQAKQLTAAGKGDTLIGRVGLMTCVDTPATAATFLSYYSQDRRLDTPYLIPKISKPVLVVAAGDDKIVPDLAAKIEPLVDGRRVRLKIVDGADHLFRDLYADEAVDAIDGFLQQLSR